MYHFKIRIPGELTRLISAGKGVPVRTSRGDLCIFRSLTRAQQAARLLAAYGLLA